VPSDGVSEIERNLRRPNVARIHDYLLWKQLSGAYTAADLYKGSGDYRAGD